MRVPRLRARLATIVTAILVVSFAIPGVADDVTELYPESPVPQASDAFVDETPELWFVELASAPVADGGTLVDTRADKSAFRGKASSAGIAYTERYAFDELWNGLSITIQPSQLSALARLSGVKALWPVATIALPEGVSDPDLATALAMTGADALQTDLGFTGSGVKVAIMDTGVDYHHPDLGGCFGAGCRVVTGWDFVGDAFNANPASPSYNPFPAPDGDPDDCNGHGTHVAGIVGARGVVTGVAPGVTFGAYRVFGCEGSTTADIMIAAMERALADGMDVLNMSIGSAFQWPQYPTAAASDRLVNKGMVVVASIGNSGASGLYSAGSPGLGAKVIGVASFDNSHINVLTFNVNPSGRQVGYLPLATTPEPPTAGTTPQIVYVGQGCNTDAYLASPAGKVALIVRGVCSFQEKYQRAANAGAVGVLIYNNLPGLFAGGGVTSRGIFGVAISQADGLHIRAQATPTLTWTSNRISAANPTGGRISSFSSYGLSPDLALKPDIGAPGGLIRSTWPLEQGGYATISGTSMSSPHVAGGVALLLEARPKTSSNAVRGILQNTASPKNWWGNPGLGFLDNVHRQGAGMLRIDDAIQATTRIAPSKLSLGESEAGPATRTVTITNTSGSDVTYTLSHRAALSTGPNTFAPSFTTGFASVAFSAPSLLVPAGSFATVDVTITPNAGLANRSQYGGYLVATGSDGSVTRVPYAGLKGDYQSFTVLTPTANGFPWLARRGATSFTKVPPASATFTMAGAANMPQLLVHLDHQSRRLRVEIDDAASGKSWHRAFDFEYLPRNAAASGFFAFAWDGRTTAGNKTYTVPDGTYVMKLSVLKALGDEANPAHWETWTSPAFTIDRP